MCVSRTYTFPQPQSGEEEPQRVSCRRWRRDDRSVMHLLVILEEGKRNRLKTDHCCGILRKGIEWLPALWRAASV